MVAAVVFALADCPASHALLEDGTCELVTLYQLYASPAGHGGLRSRAARRWPPAWSTCTICSSAPQETTMKSKRNTIFAVAGIVAIAIVILFLGIAFFAAIRRVAQRKEAS